MTVKRILISVTLMEDKIQLFVDSRKIAEANYNDHGLLGMRLVQTIGENLAKEFDCELVEQIV